MPPVIYQVRLVIKPEFEAEFNAWYEGEYIPKLMRETPHFTAVRRYVGEFNGEKLYVTDYDCTTETLALAIAEMRAPAARRTTPRSTAGRTARSRCTSRCS